MKRLASFWGGLDNYYDNNVELYDKVNSLLKEIDEYFDVLDIDKDDILDRVEFIGDAYNDIYDYIDTAKGYGQDNENELKKGNEIISEIESDIESLQEELDEVQSQIDNYVEGSIKHRLCKCARFICDVHDDIMKECKNGIGLYEDYKFIIADLENDKQIKNSYSKFLDKVFEINASMEQYINEARDLNERMSNGINNKNNTIEELKQRMSDIQDLIQEKENELSDLQYN